MYEFAALLPCIFVIIGGLIHIEISIATLKNDVKWIKNMLNGGKE